MLQFRVFAKRISRLIGVPSPRRIPIPPSLSPNSHGINVFADNHPLTTIESYRYKNIGGRGRRSDVQTFRRADAPYLPKSFSCNTYGSPRKCCKQKTYGLAKPFSCNTYKKPGVGGSPDPYPLSRSPIFRTLFQVPYPVSPLVATHTKTPGVWGYSSHFGTRRHVDVLTRRGIPVTSSAPILHGVTIHRSLTTIPLTRSLPPYFIASSLPQRAVAFPQKSTTRLLCKAVPSRTMEVHSEAKPASHASVLAGESLNRSTPAGPGSQEKTSWVR